MKRLFLLLPLLFVSCMGQRSLSKSSSEQLELTLHQMRVDIEEMKHDLHTSSMQLSILEGKILNQEDALASLKRNTIESHHAKLDKSTQHIYRLEKRIADLEQRSDSLLTSLKKLGHTSDEMQKSIIQGRSRFLELEKLFATKNELESQIAHLRTEKEASNSFTNETLTSYRVKSGDTLSSIAEKYHTTTEALEKINQFDASKVLIGQSILVPLSIEE